MKYQGGNNSPNANNVDVYVLFTISKTTSDLTQDTYTQYQRKLFDIICHYREVEGLTFPQIAEDLNKSGHRTVFVVKIFGTISYLNAASI